MEPVVEKDLQTTIKVSSISVSVVNLELGKQCNLIVGLFDSERKLLRQDLLLLDGENYQNWGADDSYIYEYVMNNYGFVKEVQRVEPVE